MELVSVIIPTHNRSGAIRKTIDSLLRLDYKKIEIIVVDDCSTDDTIQVLEKYGKRIRLVKRKTNGGPAAARNDGLKIARGKYIAFTDSDCTASGAWVSKLVKFMEKQPPHVAGVCGRIFPPKDANFLMNCIYFMPQMDGNTIQSENLGVPFDVESISCNNALWKRDVIRGMRFDESFFKKYRVMPEDSELCYRAKKKGYRFIMIPDAPTYHHFRPTLFKFLRQSYDAGRGGGVVMMKHNDWFSLETPLIILYLPAMILPFFLPSTALLWIVPWVLSIGPLWRAITKTKKIQYVLASPLYVIKSTINVVGLWKGIFDVVLKK